MGLELDNMARLMHLAVDYARSIGFTGDFYVEPKPKEPTKHQYDFDSATVIGFLQKYGLDKDFKLNIEANHATLAQHTFQHELRVARTNGMFGSIDANQGDPLLGWDTDQFPTNVYDAALCMYEVLKAGGFTNGGLNYDQKQQLKTKRLLAAQGFYEASTLAFYSNAELDMLHIPADDEARKAIRILNPISENLSIMRTLLTPSMLNVIVDNLKKGNAEGRLFEMAPVYLAKELPISEHPHERQTLCIGAFGPEEDFFTVKGALEALAEGFDLTFTYERETTPWLHPGISAAVYCNGKRLGVFGKLSNEINGELEIAKDQKDSQNIYLGELDYEALMSCVDGELRYKPLSPYAAVKRDLALVCEEKVTCGEIEETIKKASSLITEVKLFDIYRGANLGEGKKSMAFSLTLSDPSAEISAEQVERTVKKVLGNLKFKLGIEIR